MSAIAPAIKKRRIQMGLTQEEMSEKVHLSLKAWQNIENGTTKLDMDRLSQIAEILEVSVTDLINQPDGIYIEQMTNESNHVGFSAKEVIINTDISESERKLYLKVIEDKDAQVQELRNEVAALKSQYQDLVHKLAGKLL